MEIFSKTNSLRITKLLALTLKLGYIHHDSLVTIIIHFHSAFPKENFDQKRLTKITKTTTVETVELGGLHGKNKKQSNLTTKSHI